MTQGERLVQFIREFQAYWKRGPTYGDLQMACISSCPHRRLDEPGHKKALKKNEVIQRGVNNKGLVTFEIRRVRHG